MTNNTAQHPLIIGEIAQAHEGSLGIAHSYIDAIADAGAGAVKFQTHIADAESSRHEPWRVKFSYQDQSRYDYWRRMEFEPKQWRALKEHATARGLLFISSPFSLEAVDLLAETGIDIWKIASGEVTNIPLIQKIARSQKPVILSSGMSSYDELGRAVAILAEQGVEYSLLQCSTKYPTPPEDLGLNVIAEFRERYRCPVGLSDHSGEIYAGLAAAAVGADILEVHVAFHKKIFGPDTIASLDIAGLSELVRGVDFIARALKSPIEKEVFYISMSENRKIFGRSMFAKHDISIGQIIKESDLIWKKPGTGINYEERGLIVGAVAVEAICAGDMISEEHVKKWIR